VGFDVLTAVWLTIQDFNLLRSDAVSLGKYSKDYNAFTPGLSSRRKLAKHDV